jgi:hypothetical protein
VEGVMTAAPDVARAVADAWGSAAATTVMASDGAMIQRALDVTLVRLRPTTSPTP